MKKIVLLILVACLCFSLCSCGDIKQANSENASPKITNEETSQYIGVWESTKCRLTITKGGVGKLEALGYPDANFMSLNWEIKDDVLVAKFSMEGYEFSTVYELSEDASSLNVIQNGWPEVDSASVYEKQK